MKRIEGFQRQYRFLSNFFPAPIQRKGEDGKVWPTSEHLYQALKCVNPSDMETIRRATTPGNAKRLGNVFEIHSDWNDKSKEDAMRVCLFLKFSQNKNVRRLLLATGDAMLVESNRWHDNYWGDCVCSRCSNQKGQNILGKMLMSLRTFFSRGERA